MFVLGFSAILARWPHLCVNTVKPVLSDHIKQDIFLDVPTGGCLLLYESSAESSCMIFSAQLSFSNKQPPVNSDFHVT